VTLTFWQVADGLPTLRVRRQIVEQSQMHFRLGENGRKTKGKAVENCRRYRSGYAIACVDVMIRFAILHIVRRT